MGVRLVWELCCCLLWVCSSYVPSCPPARLGFGRGWPPEQIHPDQIMVGPCYVPAPHRDSPLLCMQPPDRYIVQPPRALRCVVRAVHAGAQCLFWCRYEYESSPKMVSPLPACARQPSPPSVKVSLASTPRTTRVLLSVQVFKWLSVRRENGSPA